MAFKFPTILPGTFQARTITALSLLILTLWPAFQGYQLLRSLRHNHQITPSPGYEHLVQDYQETFAYIQKNTPKTATIASIWDPVFYLYTSRKTFPVFSAALKPDTHGQITKSGFARLEKSLAYYHVDYIVDEPLMISQQVVANGNPVVDGLRHFYPDSFQLIFETTAKKIRIYRRKQAQQ